MDMRKAVAMINHIREYIVENQDDHEYAEPIDMAIEALKKQTSSLVSIAVDDQPECPECACWISQPEKEPGYCSMCGQALRWP